MEGTGLPWNTILNCCSPLSVHPDGTAPLLQPAAVNGSGAVAQSVIARAQMEEGSGRG